MKRKIIMGLLTTLTVGTLLVGCGSTPTTNDNKNSEVTSENNQSNTNESETDNNSGTVGDVIGDTEENTENTETKDVLIRTYTFPSMIDATGYTVKTIEDENVDWSSNETYVKLATGNTMTFKWESPKDCSSKVNSNNNTVFLMNDNGHFELRAWTLGWSENDYKDIKAMSKENIVSAAKRYTYPENGYYENVATDKTLRITFAVEDKNAEMKGYACYIIDDTNKVVYQFAYLETSDFYSDSRAFDVINSVEYANLPATPAE